MSDLDIINRAHVRLRETHEEAESVLESVLEQWREMADECAQIRRERDLAYSVLRKLHVETSDEGTPDAIDWYVVEKSLLADDQRALVERLRDEQ